jgi:oligoribonuclease NrnB/cAMP/cGMP phosphodiesterase (DHH superfamily)
MDLSNAKLITHKSCMDGSGCASVFIAAGGNPNNVIYSNPDHEQMDALIESLLEKHGAKQELYIADISISRKLAERIDQYRHNIKLFDHHPTASGLAEFDWCVISYEACGTRLLYDYLCEINKSEKMFHYNHLAWTIDDRDRWINKMPESLRLEELHETIGQEMFVDRFSHNPSTVLTMNENFLLSVFNQRKENYILEKKQQLKIVEKTINNQKYRIAYVLSSQYVNELCKAIYEDKDLCVDVVVTLSGRKISMRASPKCNLDVSSVVLRHGGGGHKKAAGAPMKGILGEELINLVDANLKYEP